MLDGGGGVGRHRSQGVGTLPLPLMEIVAGYFTSFISKTREFLVISKVHSVRV